MEIFRELIINNANYNGLIFFYPFIFALIISIILVPRCLSIGKDLNLYDYPEERKIHDRPIVRSGGIALFISFIVPALIFANVLNINNQSTYIFLGGSSIFFLIGIIDDFFNISPYIKLFLQLIFTSILFYLGIKIFGVDLTGLLFTKSIIYFPETVSIILTILWIVGITNSINWIDGLDGLASGTVVIYAIGILLISIISNQNEIIIISSSLLGANLGFLKKNFHPAKILMGDSGSYFLGYTLAVLALEIGKEDKLYIFSFKAILLLALPISDLIFVTFNRLIKGKNPFQADKTHLHHRLLIKTNSQKNTVILLYAVSIIFTTLAVLLHKIGF